MSQPSSPVVGDVMVGNTMTSTAAAAKKKRNRKRKSKDLLFADAIEESRPGLPTFCESTKAALARFRESRLRLTCSQTTADLDADCRAEGILIDVDLTGISGGISRSSARCPCTSQQVAWAHNRDKTFVIITSNTADAQRVQRSGLYMQISLVHVNFGDVAGEDTLLLKPEYDPIARVRVLPSEQPEGGTPSGTERGTPTSFDSMKVSSV